jgi:hypothetical protein
LLSLKTKSKESVINAFNITLSAATMLLAIFLTPVMANPDTDDTDNDGIPNALEINYGLDPDKPYDGWRDADGDHLPKVLELLLELDDKTPDNDVFNDPKLLVIQAIYDIQSRIGDQQLLNQYLLPLTEGLITPVDVYHQLLGEEYFNRMGFIGQLYQLILQRTPDLDGARYYHRQLGSSMSQQAMVEQFIHSKEFEKRHGELSNQAFTSLIAKQLSQPTAANVDQLNSGDISRSEWLLSLIEKQAKTDSRHRINMLSLLLSGQLPTLQQNTLYQGWLKSEGHAKSILNDLLSGDAYRHSRMTDISSAMDDTDEDGRPDGAEFASGTAVNVKDNDVLGSDWQFVSQMLLDIVATKQSNQQIDTQLAAMKQAKSRAAWVSQLLEQQGQLTTELLFNKLYRRNASEQELEQLMQHHDLTRVIDGMINSSEYQGRFY